MNIKQAKYIKTIYECGTITAAAKELYVSQPSLSQMLHQVEEELGMPIFDRSVSPMILTYAGEKYIETANEILAANERLELQIREMKKENTGRIRLGISVSRAIQIIPGLIPMFHKTYPGVEVEIVTAGSAELERLLVESKIDLALAALESIDRNIVYELIEQETIGLLAGKDSGIARRLPSGTPITLMDAASETFVSLTRNHSSRVVQDKLFRKYDIQPEILMEMDSLEVSRRLAVESGSVMVLVSAYLDSYVAHRGGCFYPFADYDNHRHFYACTRKGDFVPKYTHDMIRMVGEILGDRSGVLF